MNPLRIVSDWISDIHYEIRSRLKPWNRLHVTTQPIYRRDLDELYLHACFQILVNFVEETAAMSDDTSDLPRVEKGLAVLKQSDDKDQEALAGLYEWWILRNTHEVSYLDNHGPRNEMIVTDQGVMHLNFTPEQEVSAILRSVIREKKFAEDERQLRRLTKLRSKLWV